MKDFRRLLALLMSLMLLFSCALAEEEGQTFDPGEHANALELTPEEAELLNRLSQTLDETEMDIDVDLADPEVNPKLPDDVVNILLLGVDNRTEELVTGRSDANIICSISRKDGSITLTSIARDTAVEVPGYQKPRRINTAFKSGSADGNLAEGAQLALKTVNRNFQMNIERYVVINIHGLADIIDALGGLDLKLTSEEASAINHELFTKEPMDSNEGREKLYVMNGIQHLDGMQSVTFGRLRNLKGQNDINRNGRQRVLLETLFNVMMKDIDLQKLLTLIETALPHCFTNLTANELLVLGMSIISGYAARDPESETPFVKHFGIPMEKQYVYQNFEGKALLYINPERLHITLTALQELIYGQSYLED